MSRFVRLGVIILVLMGAFFLRANSANAQSTQPDQMQILITPQPCSSSGRCPVDLEQAYGARGETCAATLEEFQENPTLTHYWIEDPKITTQGRANERARQFIYWTLNTQSLDSSPIITNAWRISSNISFFLVAVVATIMGVGLIMGQRLRFQNNVAIWPLLFKLGAILLYVAFSAAILLFLIQVSEILMRFFLESVGGKDFFNIYFSSNPNEFINVQAGGTAPTGANATGNSEFNYLNFQGCRDLNIRVQEGAQAEIFLFNATNITYYVMGVMLLLRKILLWFLVFVAPFAAILIPFAFVRNVAWIWLGVFLQWLFYGPLFALFLSATSIIWKQGIPFLFNFTRVDTIDGYVYPTAINITYGGPAQHLSAMNNGNYVDTFAEYVITLIMLWACIIFPWWLLRIFRDYCCEYLLAMKNILLNMYDEMRAPQGPSPSGPGPKPTGPSQSTTKVFNDNNNTTQNIDQPTKLTTIEEIKKADTKTIINDVQMSANNLTDIANYETNQTTQKTVQKNLQQLQNPMKAETPAEREKFMNIRTELFNRANKNDSVAQQTLASITNSVTEKQENKKKISNNIYNSFQAPREQAKTQPLSQTISTRVQIPTHTVEKIASSITSQVSQTSSIVQKVVETTKIAAPAVAQIYQSWNKSITTQAPTNIVQQLSQNQTVTNAVAGDKTVINQISSQTNVPAETVQKIISSVTNVKTVDKSQQIQNVATATNVQSQKVQDIVNHYESAVTNNKKTEQSSIISQVATTTNTPAATVSNVVKTWNQQQTQNKNVDKSQQIQNVATTTNMQSQKVQDIVNNYESAVANSKKVEQNTAISQVATTTNTPATTVSNVVKTWNQQQTQHAAQTNIKQVAQAAGVDEKQATSVVKKYDQAKKEKIRTVVKKINDETKKDKKVIKDIAEKHGVEEKKVEQILDTQTEVAAEEEAQPVEKKISIPATVSLEDYEEVKKMWKKQYESGEVPATENIQSRGDWVTKDIAFITNTLNKLVSSEEEIRSQGLDDVAYILPIFMINSFKGEELLVYLKAKLEAAKSVQEMQEKEQEIKDKLQAKNDEDLVEVSGAQAEEEEKTMTMSLEREIEDDKPAEEPAFGDTVPDEGGDKADEPVSANEPESPIASALNEQSTTEPAQDNKPAEAAPAPNDESSEVAAPSGGSLAESLAQHPPEVTNTSAKLEEVKSSAEVAPQTDTQMTDSAQTDDAKKEE